MTVLTDPKQILAFRIKTIIKALELEIKTGMRHSTNAPFKSAQYMTGKRTRKACLASLKKGQR